MGRLAWSQVRFRLARALALVAGVLVAATAFTVLTAASHTAQVHTVGTVSANFKAAYDILVRPKGARTAGAGLGAAAWFAGHLPARVIVIAAAATAAGILITAAAAAARRPPARRGVTRP